MDAIFTAEDLAEQNFLLHEDEENPETITGVNWSAVAAYANQQIADYSYERQLNDSEVLLESRNNVQALTEEKANLEQQLSDSQQEVSDLTAQVASLQAELDALEE